MAKILGIYSTKDDVSFFEVTMIIDIVAVFIMAIIAIAHASIVNEGAAIIVAVFNMFISAFGAFVIVDFKKHKEVQTYNNFVYAKSRQMWNNVSIIIVLYFALMSGFWSFSKSNRTELIPILVLHIMSLLYILIAVLIFRQLCDVTNSQFSAVDGSNYGESNNHLEKTKKVNVERLRFHNIWNSDSSHEEKKKKAKKHKGQYYEVQNDVEYIDERPPEREVKYEQVNDTVNISRSEWADEEDY